MKYIVNLRVETHSGIKAELCSVTERSPKAAENAAAARILRKYGKDNVIEIYIISVTEVDHAVA